VRGVLILSLPASVSPTLEVLRIESPAHPLREQDPESLWIAVGVPNTVTPVLS